MPYAGPCRLICTIEQEGVLAAVPPGRLRACGNGLMDVAAVVVTTLKWLPAFAIRVAFVLHGRGDPRRVVAEQVDDGVAREEGIRLGTVVRQPGSRNEKLGVFRYNECHRSCHAPPSASRRFSTWRSTRAGSASSW